MGFKLIDIENWERKEFYEHFINQVVCTYSVVVNIDITNLKEHKLYPAMIWLLTKTVNDMPEFRTSLTAEGLGIYDDMQVNIPYRDIHLHLIIYTKSHHQFIAD